MGKRERRQRDAKSTRVRLEELLAKGDTRGAVDAAKLLVREEPGAASESLAVRAYGARISALIAEGLGREASAIASIVRERFPAHVVSLAPLLEDARLAAGEFDWILSELRSASDEGRAAIEERLLPWITDPSMIVRSSALDPSDPLSGESRIVAELFDIVTSRLASPEEMASLNEIRRRSPLAPWKLLVRAIDAFHRHDDPRVAANIAAIDPRSPAARGGEVLSELTGGKKASPSSASERLVDRISGGRATIAAHIRNMEAAVKAEDRRRIRDEVRALMRCCGELSPYALDQVRLALVPICGMDFEPDQVASLLRISGDDARMERYAAIIMESAGAPFASSIWIAYAEGLSAEREIEPWQAAEIYLHALSLGHGDDDERGCRDPSHGHPVDEEADSVQVIERIIASQPAPSVLARVAPYFDRLESRELRRVLTTWKKNDPNAPEPLVRLLGLATTERRYDDALALIRQGDGMNIIDPEYARLRLRALFRGAEQLLATRKQAAAEALLTKIAERPEDLGQDVDIYLLALHWAAAPAAKAGDLLADLARRGVVAEMVVAEVTGDLGTPYALAAAHRSPKELLEGVRRGIALLQSVGRLPRHSSWLIERTTAYLDQANEPQLLAIGSAALVCGVEALAWTVTARGLEIGGPMLHRMLLLRAEVLMKVRVELRRTVLAIEAARSLAESAHDNEILVRAAELEHRLRHFRDSCERLSQDEIKAIVDRERGSAMPQTRKKSRKKSPRPTTSKQRSKRDDEKGLFEP